MQLLNSAFLMQRQLDTHVNKRVSLYFDKALLIHTEIWIACSFHVLYVILLLNLFPTIKIRKCFLALRLYENGPQPGFGPLSVVCQPLTDTIQIRDTFLRKGRDESVSIGLFQNIHWVLPPALLDYKSFEAKDGLFML